MRHLRECLGQDLRPVQAFLDLDDLVALHERELMEREERGAKRKNSVEDIHS